MLLFNKIKKMTDNLGTVRYLWEGGGGVGEKMGGPEILATAKRGVLGKFFVIEGGLEILNR